MTLFKFFQKQDSVKAIAIDGTPSACDSAIREDNLFQKSATLLDSPMCLIDVRDVGIVTPIICSDSSTKPKVAEISKKSHKSNLKEDGAIGKPPLASASRVAIKKDIDKSLVLQG